MASRRDWLALVAALSACGPAETTTPALGRCTLTAWYSPTWLQRDASLGLGAEDTWAADLVGSWDNWSRPGRLDWVSHSASDGAVWRSLSLPLPPGRHAYAVRLGSRLLTDAMNPITEFVPDPIAGFGDPFAVEVSSVVMPDCRTPEVVIDEVVADGAGGLVARARYFPGSEGRPLAEANLAATLAGGPALEPAPQLVLVDREPAADGSQRLEARAAGLPPGKHTVSLLASDGQRDAEPARASRFVEPPSLTGLPFAASDGARGLGDGLVYQIVVDRFAGDGALPQPADPGLRAGGTFAGVLRLVEAGYFDRLGITTLWLSPAYRNPDGKIASRTGHTVEAYHGYWPSAPRAVDGHLGGEAQLDALVVGAHAHGLRLILDAVPNHVHETHPYYLERSRQSPQVAGAADPRRASWFNDGDDKCVCGVGCGWDETCWFETFLPDLNWRHPEVIAQGVDDLRWWMERFDLDGIRIDAVPLMPAAATRHIARGLRRQAWRAGLDLLVLGENYTGPGDLGRAELTRYLGATWEGLDSEFDFPLMWATRAVLARGARGMDYLEDEIAAGEATWAGAGVAMAHILDNHDTSRFLSEAAGPVGNPWTDPPGQPAAAEPYRRLVMGLTLVLTLPGLPVLYHGDEIGIAGSGDPDCRRTLPDLLRPAALPVEQARVLDLAGRLGRLRRCLPALRRGPRTVLSVGADHVVALHRPPGEGQGGPAVVVLNRSSQPARIAVDGLPAGRYRDVLSSHVVDWPSAVEAEALGAAVYVDEKSPCID